MKYQLGLIGAGNMAEAIVRAAMGKGVVPAARMVAADPSAARRDLFAGLGITVTQNNAEVLTQASQVLLAVKPQTLPKIAEKLGRLIKPEQVIISIMAGIATAKLAQAMGPAGAAARIIRVMPNTPMLVGLGMAGVALGGSAKPGDESLAMKLFAAGGKAILVEEGKIDAITAVSGSGPAYVFYLAEAMEKAAQELGLGEASRTLVQQTIVGAAQLLAQAPETAAELRKKVTSPGGTTEAAVKHLEGNATTAVFVNAIKAAEARARELGA